MTKINWKEVASSQIKAVAYEQNKGNDGAPFGTLYVKFNSGAAWKYLNVPEERYQHFMEATSKGNFFAKNIKGKFDEKEVFETSVNPHEAATGKPSPSDSSAGSSESSEGGEGNAAAVTAGAASAPPAGGNRAKSKATPAIKSGKGKKAAA